jgi:hypothetical protein
LDALAILEPKIVVQTDTFLNLNTNCMEDCQKMGDNSCTRDCHNGISPFESACHGAGGDVFVVARRSFYQPVNGVSSVARTNFFICLSSQCANHGDILKLEAELANLYCKVIPGVPPPIDCFADVMVWPQVSPKCEVAYGTMTSNKYQIDAQVQYNTQNQACVDGCNPRLGHSCDDECLVGQDIYDKVCRELPGQPVNYQLSAILPDNNGKALRTMRTCVPNECMASDVVAIAQRLEATTCDDYSVTEVESCTVTLLLSDPGAVAAAVIFSFLGIIGLGFAGFQLSTRAGWVSKDRLPSRMVHICECGCCPANCGRGAGVKGTGAESAGMMSGAPSTASGGYAAVA